MIKAKTNLFKNDLEGLSYFIGFLFSDGCVDTRNKRLSITSTDKDIIEKIKHRLEYTGTIKQYTPKPSTFCKKHKTFYALYLHGDIYKYILSLGITKYKETHSINALNIQLNLYAFCRGFLDGDGHYHQRKTNFGNKLHYIQFLGRATLLQELQTLLHIGNITLRLKSNTTSEQLYRYNIYGQDAYDLAHKIYNDATIYMDRKYKTWLKCKSYKGYTKNSDEMYGIYYRNDIKSRINKWRVDFTKNKKRYSKSFSLKEEAIEWRNIQLKEINDAIL